MPQIAIADLTIHYTEKGTGETLLIFPDSSIYLMSTSGHPHIEYPFMWSDPNAFRAAADRFLASLRHSRESGNPRT